MNFLKSKIQPYVCQREHIKVKDENNLNKNGGEK